MNNLLATMLKVTAGLAAALVIGTAPAGAQGVGQANGMAFTNKLDQPVLIQGSSIVNGMLVKSQPLLVYPGKTGFDANVPVGLRQVMIYDGNRPNMPLMKKVVPFNGTAVQFHVGPTVNPTPSHPYKIDLLQPKQ